MGVLLKQIGAELSSEDMHRVTILSINHQVATIMLAASLDPAEKTTYQQSDFLFTQIVTLAESLLRPVNLMVKSNLWQPFYTMVSHDSLLFNFTECVIQALYFTATKCCNRSTCRKALSFLSSEPWREGAFDSTAMAKVAERKVRQLEEEGWYSDSTASVLEPSPCVNGVIGNGGVAPFHLLYLRPFPLPRPQQSVTICWWTE